MKQKLKTVLSTKLSFKSIKNDSQPKNTQRMKQKQVATKSISWLILITFTQCHQKVINNSPTLVKWHLSAHVLTVVELGGLAWKMILISSTFAINIDFSLLRLFRFSNHHLKTFNFSILIKSSSSELLWILHWAMRNEGK